MTALAFPDGWPVAIGVSWLFTYAAHSTVILAGAWVLSRRGPLSAPAASAAVWKTAALAGLVTATIQVGAAIGREPQLRTLRARADQLGSAPGAVSEERIRIRVDGDAGPVVHWERAGVRAVGLTTDPAGSPVPVRVTRQVLSNAATGRCRELRERLGAAGQSGASPGVPGPTGRGVDPALLALVRRCGAGGSVQWQVWVLWIWLAGAGFFALRAVRASRAFSRSLEPLRPSTGGPGDILAMLIRRTGSRRVRLLETPGLSTPITLPGRRIVLPAHAPELMERGELEAALAHELAHVERKDPAWLMVLRAVGALLFFQPLNRLALSGFQEASEFLADAWAVGHTHRPLDLARSLAKASSWSRAWETPRYVSAMTRRESPVVERVRRLVAGEGVRSRGASGAWGALALLPALLLPPVQLPRTASVRVMLIREVETGWTGEAAGPESGDPAGRVPDENDPRGTLDVAGS